MTHFASERIIRSFRGRPKLERERAKKSKVQEKIDAIKAERERKELERQLKTEQAIRKADKARMREEQKRERSFKRAVFKQRISRFVQADFRFKERLKRKSGKPVIDSSGHT